MSAAAWSAGDLGSGTGSGTVLGAGTSFEGLLVFRGEARVDGALHGEVHAAGVLRAGPSADIRASIEVDELILAGRLEGEVRARQRIRLEPGARLIGQVVTPLLQVAEGAHVEGALRTGPHALEALAPSSPAGAGQAADEGPESGS